MNSTPETNSEPLRVPLSDQLGVAVLVDGAVVAWFAEMDDELEDLCRERWFGRWLTWRAKAPEIVPLTPDEKAKCEAWAAEMVAALRVE